jgi:putative Ca2+/H+ antiporter (TMEM165/GDT1 family)
VSLSSQFPGLAPLITTFLLIFVAELGDKTLYTVLILSARNPPWPVFLGACAAFVLQGAIALGLGALLAYLPHAVIGWLTAVVFVGFGLLLLFREEKDGTAEAVAKGGRKLALATFTLIFIAEWGDATQIGTATLVAQTGAPLQVFIGATLGLWVGTALAVILGRLVGARLPAKALRRTAGVLFILFGLLTAFHTVRGS